MIDIYSNPELYDAIHESINSDKELIQHYARQTNGPVLELAAGTGRLAKYILDLNLYLFKNLKRMNPSQLQIQK